MWFYKSRASCRLQDADEEILNPRLTVCHFLHCVLRDAIQMSSLLYVWSSLHLPDFVQLSLNFISFYDAS